MKTPGRSAHFVKQLSLPGVPCSAGFAAAEKPPFGKTTPPWLTKHKHLHTLYKSHELRTQARARPVPIRYRSSSNCRTHISTLTEARARPALI